MAIVFKNENNLVGEELVVGDKFAMVTFGLYENGPRTAFIYTVNRVMKRDIVCAMSNGKEFRISKTQNCPNCYLPDDPVYLAIRMEIRRKNRVMNIASHLRIAKADDIVGDEEFMTAAEAFFARLDAVKKSS